MLGKHQSTGSKLQNVFFPAWIYRAIAVFLAGFLCAAGTKATHLAAKITEGVASRTGVRIICFSCANLHNAVIFNFPFTKGKITIFLMYKNKILEAFFFRDSS